MSEKWVNPAGENNRFIICEGDDPTKPGRILFILRQPFGTSNTVSYRELGDYGVLCAAAPDMLAALLSADDLLANGNGGLLANGPSHHAIRAAIAKATGLNRAPTPAAHGTEPCEPETVQPKDQP